MASLVIAPEDTVSDDFACNSPGPCVSDASSDSSSRDALAITSSSGLAQRVSTITISLFIEGYSTSWSTTTTVLAKESSCGPSSCINSIAYFPGCWKITVVRGHNDCTGPGSEKESCEWKALNLLCQPNSAGLWG